MIINGDEDIERLQAAGKITVEDADEIRRFQQFLSDPELPKYGTDRIKTREIYLKHYPEYAE